MEFLIGLVLGLVFHFTSSFIFKKRHINGEFEVNETNPEKDVYTLFIDDFNRIQRRKYLLLRITRK